VVLKTVAVTGASGMLGRHILAALDAHEFRAIACGRGGRSASMRIWNLTQWKTDAEFDSVFESADAIVHAGASVPSAGRQVAEAGLFDANVRAPANLGGWARRRGLPVVFISGAIVYAKQSDASIRESAPLGWSGFGGFYGLSKLLAEDVLRREEQAGLRLAVLRPTSIYGHGLGAGKIVTSIATRAGAGEVIELAEPVADSTNFIHAADVASGIVKVLQGEAWRTFNIATPANTSVLELAQTCVAAAGKGRVEIRKGDGAPRAATTRFRLDCEAARQQLGWAPRVDLSEGIRSMLEKTAIVVS